MHKNFLVGLLSVFVFANHCDAQSEPSNHDLSAAKDALKQGDASYAFYKLRKAWLGLSSKTLSDKAHTEIKKVLIDAYLADKRVEDAKLLRTGKTSSEEIDRSFRQREFNGSGDQYSVELKADGTLSFMANNLDWKGEGYCGNIKMTPAENKAFNERADRIRAAWKAKMPLNFSPESPRYKELLSLSQPIRKGEKKQTTGFDFSPFVPRDLPRTPDI